MTHFFAPFDPTATIEDPEYAAGCMQRKFVLQGMAEWALSNLGRTLIMALTIISLGTDVDQTDSYS